MQIKKGTVFKSEYNELKMLLNVVRETAINRILHINNLKQRKQ